MLDWKETKNIYVNPQKYIHQIKNSLGFRFKWWSGCIDVLWIGN